MPLYGDVRAIQWLHCSQGVGNGLAAGFKRHATPGQVLVVVLNTLPVDGSFVSLSVPFSFYVWIGVVLRCSHVISGRKSGEFILIITFVKSKV